MHPDRPLQRHRTVLVAAIVAAVVGAATSAWATHQFGDVGTNDFFHPSISAIGDAGCASGYPDGTFKPDRDITRAQFALWLNRCGGRVAHEQASRAGVGGTEVDVGVEPALTMGGDAAGGGFLVVLTTVEATAAAGCGSDGCTVRFKLYRDDAAVPAEEADVTLPDGTAASGALSTVFPVGATVTTDVRLTAQVVDGGGTVTVEGATTLLSVPFAGDGTGGGLE